MCERQVAEIADKMMAAMSLMFTQAVKRGKMPANPAMVSTKRIPPTRTRTAMGAR